MGTGTARVDYSEHTPRRDAHSDRDAPDARFAVRHSLALSSVRAGGQAGDGRQYLSWIHERDFVNAVMWLIEHEVLEGPVNLASPNPLTNAEFMRVVRSTCGFSFGFAAAELMFELGAFIMGSETELILKSRR